jgi:hypothetical protein
MRWIEILTEMTRYEAAGFLAQYGYNTSAMTPDDLKAARRALARKLHPDRGGTDVPMQIANAAIDTLLKSDEAEQGADAAPEAARPTTAWAHTWLDYLRQNLSDFRQAKMGARRVFLTSPFQQDSPYFVRVTFGVSPKGEIEGKVAVEVNPNANEFVEPVAVQMFDPTDASAAPAAVHAARHAFEIIKAGRAEEMFPSSRRQSATW